LKDSVVELKSLAEQTNDSKYLKKAEEVEKQIAKFEEGQKAYLNKGKTVKQLRKELDIPVD
jgi:hypothetical protein